uniref:Uncharacterized protein n=1 Tax=Ditylenchus dipsaci TaxID=166011 RepID=A0A915DXC2_9BILA
MFIFANTQANRREKFDCNARMRIRFKNDISEHPEHLYTIRVCVLIRSSCCNIDAELELMWTELLQAETTNDLD